MGRTYAPPFDGDTCKTCFATVSPGAMRQEDHLRWHERQQQEQLNAIDRVARSIREELRNTKSRVEHIRAWLEHYGLEASINDYPPGYGLSGPDFEEFKRANPHLFPPADRREDDGGTGK